RCDKWGKAFMSESEVERHKVYEHPVPVSPFEERFAFDSGRSNDDVNIADLHRMKSNVMTGKSNNDITNIGSRQIRKVPFRPFRI
ncbi:MAG TPA: hypothetical protein VE692_06090, partial [Nitrososphaera sp.]|nr:hypothetical protein [Nitrososphaera sp.]